MDRLLELLRDRSVRRGKFVLSSGQESDVLIDCKATVLTAEGHALVADPLLSALEKLPHRCRAVAGVELGGCPLASAVSLVSFLRGWPLDAIYVRKTQKGHGSGHWLEGVDRLPSGTPVAILEDVVTTGASTLRAVEKLRDASFDVVGVIALVDRCEGGRETIESAGLAFVPLYTREQIVR